MAIGKSSTSFLLGQQEAWRRVTDFSKWQKWFWIPKASEKGLGDTIKAVVGEGEAMQLGFYCGDKLMQPCRIKEWTPPEHLLLILDEWNVEGGAYIGKKRIPGFLGTFMGNMKAEKLRITLDLSPTSPTETRMDMSIEVEFTHLIFGPLFNLFPLGGELGMICDSFQKRFTQSLEKK